MNGRHVSFCIAAAVSPPPPPLSPIEEVRETKKNSNPHHIIPSLPPSLPLPKRHPPRPNLKRLPRGHARLPLLHPHRRLHPSLPPSRLRPPSLPHPGPHETAVVLFEGGGGGGAAGVEPEGRNEDVGPLEGEALLVAFHFEDGAIVGHHGEDEAAGAEDTEDVVDQGIVRLQRGIGLKRCVGAFGLGSHCVCQKMGGK